jgi:hypothetical protein
VLSDTRFGPFQIEWVESRFHGLERLSKGGMEVVLAVLSLCGSHPISSTLEPVKCQTG